jgi:glucose-6-phosphate 1-dehydrogenase
MKRNGKLRDTIFVLFGAAGDLAQRLIMPAIYNLFLDNEVPERFLLIGVDRSDYTDQSLAEHYHESIANFSRRGAPTDEDWTQFSPMIRYIRADVTDQDNYGPLKELLNQQENDWNDDAEQVFYMATPPSLFEDIACCLGNTGLSQNRDRARIVVEKPLGHDLDSSREINQALARHFSEQQIFRIDHYLGKETVQNILALRFANPTFEPVWNRRYVDHVAITVAETLGVEHRAGYYDKSGALRDMVQNHLMQLLCLIAMEPPVAYDAEDIRGKKMDVLNAIRPIPKDDVSQFAARGQYADGWINGERVPAYCQEPNIPHGSKTETYAALKLFVDNWRWQGVPFYLRTGKRMASQVSELSIRFRDVPHRSFPASVGLNEQPARLIIQVQPQQGVVFKFMAKEPGSQLRLRPVNMRFCYEDAFQMPTPDAYETLIWDIMRGDATLFMRADQVEAAWKLIMPVLEVWEENPAPDFPNYSAGSWGPEAAEVLVARDGNSWLVPTLPNQPQECRIG